jgi:hypothetical protein
MRGFASVMLKIRKTPNLTELAYRSIKQGVLDGSLGDSARLTEESVRAGAKIDHLTPR